MDKTTVKEWLKYAGNDLEAANHLLTLHPLKLEIICYLCQQSADTDQPFSLSPLHRGKKNTRL